MFTGRQILFQLIFISVIINFTYAKYFIWISGSDQRNQKGIYGTRGEPGPDYVPGARRYAVSWIDSENNFYLFGGYGYDVNGNKGIFLFVYCFYCFRLLK